MTTQAGDKVRLETTASTKSIPRATRREEYAVLVRVTAAPGAVSARADGVDLVAVLDISGSTSEEEGLERMKQAMVFVIDNLGPDDRLSVVSFDDQVQRRTELSQMSEGNRAVARAVVDKLTAAPAGGGGVNTTGATEEAAKILAQRGEDENTNRVGRIIFLSNGGDDDDGDVADPGQKQDSLTSPDLELSAEAFGLGADDSLSALSYGAGKTSGVYSYGKQDVDNIKDAHTHGFMSVDAALGVQIDLQAQEGVAISALGSGGHRVSVGTGVRGSVTIYIHDLYPGEHKSFIVYLTVPEDEERLLTVGGLYRDPDHGDDIQFDDTEVSVLRPDDAGTDETICPGVAAELDRARRLVNLAMEANAKPIPMLELPQEDEGGVVEETIPDDKKPDNVPETLEIPVLVTEREDFTNQANKEKEEEGKLGKVEIIWVSNNPYYSGLIFAATVLLLGAAMLLTSNGGQKRARTSLVDISQHPGWPKMEKSLGLAMAKKVEDSGITSSLHGVSVEDMSRTIITYIHLALVHASGITRLEQRVQVLEAEKEELRVMVEAVTEEIAEEEMATSVACRDKNEAAVERAHTRIVELEQQLQGKKAFAESLRSEVANTDAHLVNCSHTVEMLEAKVREMEGAHPNIIHSR
ncbi:uncharacterized protein [Lolium perenne]|uniref:uncharacterized protein isoform X1 n=1 Tax=Lolium perenne TaxID=4522 RepID=UPI0021EA6190|nr:uncharacterized protein LOC127345851 isoform X1 [Lolium perenne]XP_051228343.1 uncharacterized protein LOC127345851 isoform X2 [Lolium perenne]